MAGSIATLQIPLTLPTLWLLGGSFLGSIAFWTIESLEIMNILTYDSVETAQYPLSIYNQWFQRFFTVVIPLVCVSYFPLLAVRNKASATGS
jgi:ABC-2 type transport system permease protein